MRNRNRTPALATPATPEVEVTEQSAAPAEVAESTETVETAPAAKLEALVYDKQIGIIGHLRSALNNPAGVTKGEMNVRLVQLFPGRDPMGMATTVQIQLGRLQKKYGKIISVMVTGRGRVYGFEATLANPAPVVVEAAEVTEQVEVA